MKIVTPEKQCLGSEQIQQIPNSDLILKFTSAISFFATDHIVRQLKLQEQKLN